MTLRNSWPGPSGVTTTTDARIVHGGLIDDYAAGTPRVGVFPVNLNAIVTARTDMNVDIAAFQAVGNQFGGPILIANDGTIQLPAVLVSPASGTNFYVIYVKQDESTSPGTDADNLPKVGTVLSTTSFAAARATLPTGALELATVQVPTGVAATNAGGVTITQTFVYTTAEGGVVPARNSTELAGWTPADGSFAWQVDQGIPWARKNTAWVPLTGLVPIIPTSVAGGTLNSDGSISATGSRLNLSGVFNQGFDTVMVMGALSPASSSLLYGVLRNGGSDVATNYGQQLMYGGGATVAAVANPNGTTNWQLSTNPGVVHELSLDVINAGSASPTIGRSHDSSAASTASMGVTTGALFQSDSSAYDGLGIGCGSVAGSVTMSGKIRVFGVL